MHTPLNQQDGIESLIQLRSVLLDQEVPSPVINEAINDNPWFSDYYINHSLQHILSWLTRDSLESFCSAYPGTPHTRKRIGIITASNLPFVGFHDILIGILSGQELFVKCSRRDKVLMHWLIGEWKKIQPALTEVLHLVETLPDIHFLIATGSNNTARYLEDSFKHIPKVLRKHRYSVAVIDHRAEEEELRKLCDDIFLFNGMGCRSVCNIIGTADFNLYDWTYLFKDYPKERLHPQYLEKVAWERASLRTKKAAFTDAENILIIEADELSSTGMGCLNYLKLKTEGQGDKIIEKKRDQIQCIVNKGTKFGQSQYPSINIFADDLDTMSILTYSVFDN